MMKLKQKLSQTILSDFKDKSLKNHEIEMSINHCTDSAVAEHLD